MRRFSAYTLLILYLCATTEAYQVLKFPLILQHFHQHQKENNDITFLEFLDIHYMHGSPKDADYDLDMQLPFKRVNHHMSLASVHIKQLPPSIIIARFPLKEDQLFVRNDEQIYSRHLPSIFQPPRA